MTIERTDVQIEVQGEQQAVADANRVGREMDAVTRKATQAEAAARKATAAGGRLNDLFAQARQRGIIKRNGFEAGLLEFNQGGFGVNRSALRGAGAGAGGAALMGVAVAHGVGAGLNQVADLKDYVNTLIEQKLSAREIASNLSIKASESIYQASGATSILKGILRLGGERSDVVEEAFRLTFATKDELIAEDKAEKRAARARREALEAIKQAQGKAITDLEARKREAMQKADESLEREIAGIKHETLPVGLPRNLAAVYRARRVSEANGRAMRRREAVVRNAAKVRDGQGD